MAGSGVAGPTALAAASGSASDARLITAALVGIAVIVLLITVLKLHPFLSLTLGSLVTGAISGIGLSKTVTSYGNGIGSTVASVGTLIALGAMLGRLLVDSGGADQIVDTLTERASPRTLPWAMALVGAIVGLPMFFEIGLVLLVPVIVLVAQRSNVPLMRVAMPAVAGLSAMHGFVPPHPGPLAAIASLKADLGLTIGFGLIVAVPSLIVAGPLFSYLAVRWVPVDAPTGLYRSPGEGTGEDAERAGSDELRPARRPRFSVTVATVLLPLVLMLAKAIADIVQDTDENAQPRAFLDVVGNPLVALLIAVLVALFTLGVSLGMGRSQLAATLERSLPPIAGILLIVAAGGGFKQVLTDTGIAKILAKAVEGSSISPLLVGWFLAVLIRLATGSATVATVTSAGILAPLAHDLGTSQTSLLVLAIGAGSLFFSHVNDAGFWLTKEYFGLSVGQNIKTWSILETILSVCGLGMVMVVNLFV